MRWWFIALTACGSSAALPDAMIDAGLPDYAQHATLVAPMPAGANFGTAVAISGDGGILAIGDPGATVAGVKPVGSVHIFARDDADWEEQAVITPAVGHPGDFFGGPSLSTFGDTLVVGAAYESSNATGVNGDANNQQAMAAGAAYVFHRAGTSWSQVAYLKASNTEALDEFGSAVAVSGDGNTVAVAAFDEGSNASGVNGDQTNNLATNAGAVYVFKTDGTTWSQEAYLKASNTDANDHFGTALSLSADGATLAVGAEDEDSAATSIDGDQTDNSAINSGAVYVFRHAQAGWSQTAYLKASNAHAMAEFGTSVSLSGLGTTLAVGAPSEQSNGSDPSDTSAMDAGAAYVFAFDGTAWSQRVYLKAAHPEMLDLFGNSVSFSLDGKVLAVSDNGDDSIVMDSGSIATFAESGGSWPPLAVVKAPTPVTGDYLGSPALSSTGAYLLVGAHHTTANSGAAYVFY